MENNNENSPHIGHLAAAVFIVLFMIIGCIVNSNDEKDTKKTYVRQPKYKVEYSVTYTPYGEMHTVTYKQK